MKTCGARASPGVCDDYDDMSDGFGEVSEGAGDIALVMEPPGRRARSPVSIRRPGAFDSRQVRRHRCGPAQAVDRQLREAGITPTRLLRASFFCGAWMYEYELVGHGWVKRLRDRRFAPPINVDAVVSALGKPWAPGGRAGACKAPPDGRGRSSRASGHAPSCWRQMRVHHGWHLPPMNSPSSVPARRPSSACRRSPAARRRRRGTR